MMVLARQRAIIDYTLARLARRKGKNGALFFVYLLTIFLLASVLLLVQSLRQEAAIVLAEAPDLVVQRVIAGRHEPIPVQYGATIRGIPGVGQVRERRWGYYYDQLFGANYTLLVAEGLQPADGSTMVGSGLARSSMAAAGNIMPLRTHTGQLTSLAVTSILPESTELVAADLVLLSLADFRLIFGMADQLATDFAVAVQNPDDLPAIAREIGRLLPDTRQITRSDILRTYDEAFSWRSGSFPAIIGGALLALMMLIWDRGAGMPAEERRELGILKALGWDAQDVLALKFWEGMIISGLAFLGGVILAYLHIFMAEALLFAPVLRGWAVLVPRYTLLPAIDYTEFALLVLVAVGPYILAALVPTADGTGAS